MIHSKDRKQSHYREQMYSKKPSLIRPFELSELETVDIITYEDDEDDPDRPAKKHYSKLPIFDGEIINALPAITRRLLTVGAQKQFTDADYWAVFPQMLVDAAAEDWELLMNTVEAEAAEDGEEYDYTLENFQTQLGNFIALYYQPSDRIDAIDWMKTLQQKEKPSGMSLFRVLNRLKTLVLDYTAIPSPDEETLTNNDIKKIIYEMANKHEKAEIQRKFGGPTGCTLEELKDCLNTEERVKAIYKTSSKNTEQDENNNDDTDNKDNANTEDKDNSSNAKGKLHKKKQNTKFGKDNKQEATFTATWGPQAKCNKHPNGVHAWIDCRLNPRSKNYDAAAADRHYEKLRSSNGYNNNNNDNNNLHNGNGQGRRGYGGPTHQGNYYQNSGPPNQYNNHQESYHYQGSFNAPPPPQHYSGPPGNYNYYHNNMPQSGGHYGQRWHGTPSQG